MPNLNPTIDGYIQPPSGGSWASNFMLADSGDNQVPLMQFDFSSIGSVSSAILHFTAVNTINSGSITIVRNLSEINTNTTWANKPATDSTGSKTVNITTTPEKEYIVNVTEMAKKVQGNSYFGITLEVNSINSQLAAMEYGFFPPYLVVSSVPLELNNIYVDHTNGDDGNVGTITEPLKTLDLAARRVNSGGTVHIKRMPSPYENVYYPNLGQIAPTNKNVIYYLY